jgi:hypothetical protein
VLLEFEFPFVVIEKTRVEVDGVECGEKCPTR